MPLGNYIARVYTAKNHSRAELGIYRLCGVDPDTDMRWTVYVRSILAFSMVGVLSCTCSSGSSTGCSGRSG